MNYRILLFTDDGAAFDCREIVRVDCPSETPMPALALQLERGIQTCVTSMMAPKEWPEGTPECIVRGEAPRGRPGQLVQILALENPALTPSGVTVNETYGTRELSTMLGYNYNNVVQAISVARTKRTKEMAITKDPTEKMNLAAYPPQATLRGVTFCYLNDINPE